MWHIIRLCFIPSASARAEYCRRKRIYAEVGENVEIMSRVVPLYPKLIKIGNNVSLTSGVDFITHNVTHTILNRMNGCEKKYQERIGCIEIMDNVFVGAGTKILYNVKIGSNVIIAAGSVITKDIPPNTIAGGIPAKVICDLGTYLTKRNSQSEYPSELKPSHQEISPELVQWAWGEFYKTRGK